jgi:hypothetical protein
MSAESEGGKAAEEKEKLNERERSEAAVVVDFTLSCMNYKSSSCF